MDEATLEGMKAMIIGQVRLKEIGMPEDVAKWLSIFPMIKLHLLLQGPNFSLMAEWHCIYIKQNKMTKKTKNTIGWALSGFIGLMLCASAFDKISGSEHALKMATSFGLSSQAYAILGTIEVLSVLLFLYPRTGILGTLLLSSYLGGAIATHLQHQQNILFPMAIEAFVWITAIIRFPELSQRLFNNAPDK